MGGCSRGGGGLFKGHGLLKGWGVVEGVIMSRGGGGGDVVVEGVILPCRGWGLLRGC